MRKLLSILGVLLITSHCAFAADTEVQDLTDISSPEVGDDLYIVDSPDGTPASKKINIGNLLAVAADLDATGEVANDSHAHTTTTLSGIVNGDLSGSAGITGANILDDTIDSAEYAADSIDNEHVNWADIDNLGDEGTVVVADTTDATSFVALWEAATGSLAAKSDGGITYNAGTANLTTTTFTGALVGNSTTTTTALAGDAAVDFFGAGVDAVTDATECTDIEGTGLSITAGTLNSHVAVTALEGTAILSTGEAGGSKFLREDGDGTCSWQAAAGGAEVNNLETVCTDIATTEIFIGNAPNTGVYVALSNDVTMDNAGAVTIATNAVALTTDTTGNYAAGDGEAGAATSGDSATAFFAAGTIEHERGGLQADISAFTGLIAVTGADTTAEIDSKAELEGQIANVADFAEADGDVWTGVHDAGGATSFEVPNTAGDVTVDAAGEIAIDSTQKQLAWFGDVEYAIPGIHIAQGSFDLASQWDLDSDLWLIDLHADRYPNGIVITAWFIDASVADPTTELNANLMYADAVGAGAFPGANPVLIDVLDSTTGNSTEATMSNSDLGSGVIPTGKSIYMDIDIDPADANVVWHLRIHFYIPES